MNDLRHFFGKEKRKKVFRFAAMLLAAMILVGTPTAPLSLPAAALTEKEINDQLAKLEKEKQKLQNQIKESSGQIQSLAEEQKNLKKQSDLVAEQIDLVISQIEALDQQIAKSEEAIALREAEINEKKAANEENYERLCKRLQAINKSGNMSTLQMLADTEDYTDYLIKSKLMECIAENDQKLIDSIDAEIQEINKEREKLTAERDEIAEQKNAVEKIKQENEARKKELDTLCKQVQKNEMTLQTQLKKDKNELEAKQKEEDKLEEELRKLSQKGDENYSGKYTNGSMFWPVPTVRYISSPYGDRWGKLHKGIDIANHPTIPIYGQNIVAAADGVVIKAYTADTYGGGYGYHVMIDHGKDSKGRKIVTLYAHCSAVKVKVGDIVKGGQTVIAQAGKTGNVTGPHLHFEVRVDGTAVDPIANGYVSLK